MFRCSGNCFLQALSYISWHLKKLCVAVSSSQNIALQQYPLSNVITKWLSYDCGRDACCFMFASGLLWPLKYKKCIWMRNVTAVSNCSVPSGRYHIMSVYVSSGG
jgi:hypothetical protein